MSNAPRPRPPSRRTWVQIQIAGFVGDQSDAVWFDHQGGVARASDVDVDYAFVGPFNETARVAWNVLLAFDPALSLTDSATLRKFMESLASRIPGLGVPIDVWEITQTECRRA